MKSEDEQWKWQEPETTWKGVGIYHVTMVVSSRENLLGTLVIPNDDPEQAHVERSELGERLVDELVHIHEYYPEILILQYCLMPDHIHMIIYVRHAMEKSINEVIRGFWQGAKKIARLSSLSVSSELNSDKINEDYLMADPIFTTKPFIRPLSRKGQLNTMMRYVKMNPQRLATKRLNPGYFYVQQGVEIGERTYETVGNIKLLQAARIKPVHVRSMWVRDAEEHGDDKALKNYKNGCVLAARKGTVMVSPFISEHEKAVLDVLLKEKHYIIYITDNGFGQYFKPSDTLFEAVADGRLLILSPWPYDPKKRQVTRAECVEMNKMAEEIANDVN
jgi:hypothetical protein